MKKLLVLVFVIGIFGIGYFFGAGDSANIPSERTFREFGLATKVRTALELNKQLDGSEIEVSVDGTTVRLSGKVPSAGHRQLAAEIAAGIEGTADVRNDLTVAPELAVATDPTRDRSLGQRLDDLTATARIRTALALHRDIKRGNVSVSVVNSVATLTGEVPSWAARELAAKVAEDVEGVQAVENQLRVPASGGVEPGGEASPPATPMPQRVADGSIRLQLEAALTVHPYIEARRVHVEVENGVVTLSGTVRTEADRALIQKIAEDGWGVRTVVNTIAVDPNPPGPIQYAPSAGTERRSPARYE